MNNPTLGISGILPSDLIVTEKKSSLLKNLRKIFKSLILPYWFSEEKLMARILLVTVISLNIGFVYVTVLVNNWEGQIFNTIQQMDKGKFFSLIFQFPIYIFFFLVTALTKEYLQDYLCFRWRTWMTNIHLTKWLTNKAFYKTLHPEAKFDNPDQRISQDINNFAFITMRLLMTSFSSIITTIAFANILWGLSPAVSLAIIGLPDLYLSGYMLWLTIIYALIASLIIYMIGKPMVKLDFIQEKTEANFRFSMMRMIDRKEETALINGEHDDFNFFKKIYHSIRDNFKEILIRRIYINISQNFFLNATAVIPLLAAAPMYFAGAITLGAITQLTGAFNAIENALMIFVINFQTLASWKTIANRLEEFLTVMDATNSEKSSAIKVIYGDRLVTKDLAIYKSKNHDLLFTINLDLNNGEKVLLKGPSGIGKTTLIKTIAGIWPYANGEITRPTYIEIVPQKPYFPITTLRDAILYGNANKSYSDETIFSTLQDFGLSHLFAYLNMVGDWNTKLSLGEQQRLNFVRISLIKPKWLILDEPTASLDVQNQTNAMNKLFRSLAESTILTISHSQALEVLHNKVIMLD
ncbi:MAG: ABC transporter ATP-binding protein/permease [Candidatus Berkiellales bacterium]